MIEPVTDPTSDLYAPEIADYVDVSTRDYPGTPAAPEPPAENVLGSLLKALRSR